MAWVSGKDMVIVPEVAPDNLYKQYTEFSTLPILFKNNFLAFEIIYCYGKFALFGKVARKPNSYTTFQIKKPLSPSLEVREWRKEISRLKTRMVTQVLHRRFACIKFY